MGVRKFFDEFCAADGSCGGWYGDAGLNPGVVLNPGNAEGFIRLGPELNDGFCENASKLERLALTSGGLGTRPGDATELSDGLAVTGRLSDPCGCNGVFSILLKLSLRACCSFVRPAAGIKLRKENSPFEALAAAACLSSGCINVPKFSSDEVWAA